MTQLAPAYPYGLPQFPLYEQPSPLAAYMEFYRTLRQSQSRGRRQFAVAEAPPAPSIQEELASKRSRAKSLAREYETLFSPDWLSAFSRQIDLLLDPDEWVEGDDMVSLDSFETLLNVLVTLRKFRRPGLGLTSDGNLVATWSCSPKDRLIVECLPTGKIKWIATAPIPQNSESGSLETIPERLLATLAPFHPEHWLEAK